MKNIRQNDNFYTILVYSSSLEWWELDLIVVVVQTETVWRGRGWIPERNSACVLANDNKDDYGRMDTRLDEHGENWLKDKRRVSINR